MNSISESLNYILNDLSESEKLCYLKNRYPYIFTKASYFIKQGPKLYSEKDALKMPDDSFSNEDLENLKIGCNQLINGIGLSLENPLKELGVRGCHKLFNLFHFEMVSQKAFNNKDGNFVDMMTFRHVVDQKEITYYNLVVI